jgi:hypothetical protein
MIIIFFIVQATGMNFLSILILDQSFGKKGRIFSLFSLSNIGKPEDKVPMVM